MKKCIKENISYNKMNKAKTQTRSVDKIIPKDKSIKSPEQDEVEKYFEELQKPEYYHPDNKKDKKLDGELHFSLNPVLPFQDLQIGKKYTVIDYDKKLDGEFGKRCVMTVYNEGDDKELKVWATPNLSTYIHTESPQSEFCFTVRLFTPRDKNEPIKYADFKKYNKVNLK